jgi:hypothetical protein
VADIAPDVLYRLQEYLALLSAPADEQWAWAEAEHTGIEELKLRFFDVAPVFVGSSIIDDAAELAVLRLCMYLSEMGGQFFLDRAVLNEAAQWKRVRELAAAALSSLRRLGAVNAPWQLPDLGQPFQPPTSTDVAPPDVP